MKNEGNLYPFPWRGNPISQRGRVSREFLEAERFSQHLIEEAQKHPAVRHPYLKALAEGKLSNLEWALKDFSVQYQSYTAHLIRFLMIVISKLHSPQHQESLLHNLIQQHSYLEVENLKKLVESGIDSFWIQNIPRPELSFHQQNSRQSENPILPEDDYLDMFCWREIFSNVLENSSSAEVIGSLGLGKEAVAQYTDRYLNRAIELYQKLPASKNIVFEIHSETHEKQYQVLLKIVKDFIQNEQGRQDLRQGMYKELNLRASFWDWMYERALHPQNVSTPCDSAADLYNRSAEIWKRSQPCFLSDYTARPFLISLCQPILGNRILDLGCGEGYFSRLLKKEGAASIEGIDISSKMIQFAQENEKQPGLQFREGNALDLGYYPSHSFDKITAIFLFNYLTLEETQQVMTEVFRLLKPGGHFIFSAPHPFLPWMRPEEPPIYFSKDSLGYFSGRNKILEGKTFNRNGQGATVRCYHKTFEDYFQVLKQAGFKNFPEIFELRVEEELMKIDPKFFRPLEDQPLHLAFRISV